MAKGLYGAYRAAGKAGGAYASSLQDIMNVGYEQEHSKQMFDIGQEESDRKYAFGQQVLGLASTVFGGMREQKEAVEDIGKAYPKAEQTYGESKFGDFFVSAKATEGRRGEGETRWGELGEKLNVLFGGKSSEWTLEKGVGGIKAGVHRQSSLLPAAKLSLYGESDLKDDDVYGPKNKECPDGQYKNTITGECE